MARTVNLIRRGGHELRLALDTDALSERNACDGMSAALLSRGGLLLALFSDTASGGIAQLAKAGLRPGQDR